MIDKLVEKSKRLNLMLLNYDIRPSSKAFQDILILAKEIHQELDQMTGPVEEVKGMKSVILYFENQKDLDDFVNAIRTVKPNMVTRKL